MSKNHPWHAVLLKDMKETHEERKGSIRGDHSFHQVESGICAHHIVASVQRPPGHIFKKQSRI